MQPVSSGIWTRVAVSISYDDNHYTTGTSLFTVLYQRIVRPAIIVYLFIYCMSLIIYGPDLSQKFWGVLVV